MVTTETTTSRNGHSLLDSNPRIPGSRHETLTVSRLDDKRAYRVMREHGLLLQQHTGRPADTRAHDERIAVDKSNTRWCLDGFEIGCQSGERVWVAFALDSAAIARP